MNNTNQAINEWEIRLNWVNMCLEEFAKATKTMPLITVNLDPDQKSVNIYDLINELSDIQSEMTEVTESSDDEDSVTNYCLESNNGK